MSIKVRDNTGTLRTITRGSVMVGGILRPLRSVKIQDSSGTLRTVFTGLSLSPNFTEFSATGDSSTLTTSPSCFVSVTGGTPAYTYAWTVLSAVGTGTPSALSPSSSTTAFRATGLVDGEPLVVVFRCTVTDSASVVATVDISVTFTRISYD